MKNKIEDSKLLFTIVVVVIIFDMITIGYVTMKPLVDSYVKSLFKSKTDLKKDNYKEIYLHEYTKIR